MIVHPRPPPDGVALATGALLRLLRRRRWALRVVHIVIGVVLAAALPLLAVAPRAGGAALLLLPGVWTLYLLVDTALLLAWRRRVLRAWRGGEINLGVLAEAVATLPNLPRASVEAVLGALPVLSALDDRDLLPAQRVALAAASRWRWGVATAVALLPTMVLGLLCSAAAVALLSPDAVGSRFWLVLAALVAAGGLVRFALSALRRRAIVKDRERR